MTGLKSKLIAVAAALLLSSGAAIAQTTAPAASAPAAPAPAPAAVPAAAPKADAKAPAADVAPVKKAAPAKKGPPAAANRTPESLACSAELDAKGIHGKAAGRPAAMRKCVADAKKSAATAKKN